MELAEMYTFIPVIRVAFEYALKHPEEIEPFAKIIFKGCGSVAEEEVIMDNLMEVLKNHLKNK